jgi:hypothetical protein
MAANWRSAVADSLWVKEAYNDDPINPSAKVLIRAIYGLDRTKTVAIINTLNASKTVVGPHANGAAISGTFRVIKNECRPSNDGNLAGSDVVIQTLGEGYFTTLTAANKFVVKHGYETEEQNENAWAYYSRGTVTETSRWVNINPDNIASLYPYTTSIAFNTAITGYSTPIILENWYEKEQDGSYSMYRTLFARSLTSTMKYRDVQYAGLILTNELSPPMEGDVTIYLSGFRLATETIYKYAKFSIGGDTYRVTADTVASGGNVTVPITPEVSLSTETTCDTTDLSPVQVYFEALT